MVGLQTTSQEVPQTLSRPVELKFYCLLFFLLTSCATYQSKVDGPRNLLAQGNYDKAIAELEPLANKEGGDQLMYKLDYGVALQQAGRYKESAKAFNEAEKIADVQDYHSISKVTGSLLLSEEMKQYKGEDYEKVLINALNAINYVMMGELDEALVESRKLNNKLYKYKFEAKKNFAQNPYAFYLSAIAWEADRKWDDAYIDYKKAYELAPDFPNLKEDLIRSAIRASREDELAKWKKAFPEVKIRPEWKDPSYGEIVLIYLQGWGPRKHPRPENARYPMLIPVASNTRNAQLKVGTKNLTTAPIFSVEDVAIKTLDADYASLMASRVAGVATKMVVADQIRQKNELLGNLALIGMLISDRADLRQWSTLPQTFQIARTFVKAGKHNVSVNGVTATGAASGEGLADKEIFVKPGQKFFLSFRSFR